MAAKDVYTTGEVAAFCKVERITVIRWADRGELPAHQLPGRGDRRFTREDLLAFLKKNKFPLPAELAEVSNTILVVDDEEPIVKSTCALLRHAGFQTASAGDGFQAGILVERLRPALVILDLMMPGINGYEVLALIRRQEELKNTKVLVVSALPEAKIEQAMEAGADDFLTKPFQHEELMEKVGRLTGIRPARAEEK